MEGRSRLSGERGRAALVSCAGRPQFDLTRSYECGGGHAHAHAYARGPRGVPVQRAEPGRD